MSFKILCMSDTHGLHERIQPNWLPHADVLVHAGDISNVGKAGEIDHFCNWFANLKGYDHKIFIAGNHDLGFEKHSRSYKEIQVILKTYEKEITYLEDEGMSITKDLGTPEEQTINIWGSPWQPEFHKWAFNLQRGKELEDKWKLIPDNTDVLITHGPPYGIGDFVPYKGGEYVGCRDLLDRLCQLEKLKAHIFGHIHYSYGHVMRNNFQLVNASVCNEGYAVVNKPILIEI